MNNRNDFKRISNYLKFFSVYAIVATVLAFLVELEVGIACFGAAAVHILSHQVILKNRTDSVNDGLEERDIFSSIIATIGFAFFYLIAFIIIRH